MGSFLIQQSSTTKLALPVAEPAVFENQMSPNELI